MLESSLLLDDVAVPRLFYGTAWKEEQTCRLVELAIATGFRAIDTANQRRHYHEAAVGEAVRASIAQGIVSRDDLFLQTKFTFQAGQDHRLPYDPAAAVARQVDQSFASSIEHLGVERIDSYVLHGPSQRSGLGPADWEAWQAMEAIQQRGGVRFLGVSNVSLDQLRLLVDRGRVRPRFVQNRCFAALGWDRDIRAFCAAESIAYQGFSLLTANREALNRPAIGRIAQRHNRTVAQVIFRFAIQRGMIALTGTISAEHMSVDLGIFDFQLEPEETERIENIAIT